MATRNCCSSKIYQLKSIPLGSLILYGCSSDICFVKDIQTVVNRSDARGGYKHNILNRRQKDQCLKEIQIC